MMPDPSVHAKGGGGGGGGARGATQWLRAPCNGVSKTDIVVGKVQCVCVCARSTQYADGRTLG